MLRFILIAVLEKIDYDKLIKILEEAYAVEVTADRILEMFDE